MRLICLALALFGCAAFEPSNTPRLSEHCSAVPLAPDTLAIVSHCAANGPVLASNEMVSVIRFPTHAHRFPEVARPAVGPAADGQGLNYEIRAVSTYCEEGAPCREVFSVWPAFDHTDSGRGIYQHGKLVGLAFAVDGEPGTESALGWAVSSAEIPHY
jgi:hypothetical protein